MKHVIMERGAASNESFTAPLNHAQVALTEIDATPPSRARHALVTRPSRRRDVDVASHTPSLTSLTSDVKQLIKSVRINPEFFPLLFVE